MHVFFDLDGTLTDSAPGILRCFAHALERLGVDAGETPAACLHRAYNRSIRAREPAASPIVADCREL